MSSVRVFMRVARVIAAGSTIAVAAALALSEADVLGLSDPLGVARGDTPTDKLAIVLRFASLFLALASVRRRPWESAGAAALLVASLAVRGLLGPGVVAAAAAWTLAFRSERADDVAGDPEPGASAATLAAPLALAAIIVLDRAGQARPRPPPPRSPPELVTFERARGNAYRERFAALEWARGERVPAEGHLALAQADWNLGLHAKALKVVEKVIANGEDEALRQRAEALRTSWSSGGQP